MSAKHWLLLLTGLACGGGVSLRGWAQTNDSFANSTTLSGTSATASGNNTSATKETGEPNHAGNNGGASVWFNWTAPATGPVTVDTLGSSFNTLLAVYTGSPVGALTLVASNDDISLTVTQSQVTFMATQGVRYSIALDGFATWLIVWKPAKGDYVLNLQMPAAVAINSPADGAVLVNIGFVPITAAGSSPGGALSKIEFYADGSKVGETTTSPGTIAWSNAPAGSHVLTAILTDALNAHYTSAPVRITVAGRNIVNSGSVWKYLDNGTDQGTAWVSRSFNDNSWAAGPAELGYGNGGEATVVSFGPNSNSKYITTYFRRSFVVTNASSFTNLILSVLRDDGAVVYLNGTEAARFNMPAGAVSSTTLANNATDDGTLFFPTNVDASLLVDGTNVLAVEVHQAISSSSDLEFDLALSGQPDVPSNLAVLTSPTNGAVFAGPLNLALTAAAATVGNLTNVQFFANGLLVGQDATRPYGCIWSNASVGSKALAAVACDAQGGRFTSAVVNVTVSAPPANTNAPVIAAVSPPAGASVVSLISLQVTFSEAVIGVEAGDLLLNGVAATNLTGSGASYTFSFAQPASNYVSVRWAVGHGITDVDYSPRPFDASGVGATWSYSIVGRTTLVATNAAYRYRKGTSEASSPTNAWRLTSFDDSAWLQGQAPFYYDRDVPPSYAGNTVLSDMYANYSSVYLRTVFNVTDPNGVSALTLRYRCDDGFVAWINGVEVERYNVAAGADRYNSLASGATPEPLSVLTTNLADPHGYLVTGNNVLAIHLFNSSLNSSDLLLETEIYTYLTNASGAGPRVASVGPAPGTVLNLTNIAVVFSEAVRGVNASDLLINGVAATSLSGGASNTTYRFGFAQPAYGPVAITWAANHGITDFDAVAKAFDANGSGATWQYYLANPTVPRVAAQTPAAGSTVDNLQQITVTFSEAVTGVNASDLLVNGVPATGLAGLGAIFAFTFAPPAPGAVAITWATNHGIQDLDIPANGFNAAVPGNTWSYVQRDLTPPAVAAQSPVAGTVVANLRQITVVFTEAVAGVGAGDLLVNGKPATNVSGSGTTYTFGFAPPNGTNISVSWAASHGITDLASPANAFNGTGAGGTWSYASLDQIPPSVSRLFPQASTTVRSLTQIMVSFDEPVAGLEAGDLLVNGQAAVGLTGTAAGPYTFSFSPPATGRVQVAWAPAHGIHDLAIPPNAFAGGSWTYQFNPKAITYVIHISMDMTGGLWLQNFLNNGPAFFPAFMRLRTGGAWTLNARSDYDQNVTLPNHTTILTGRPVERPTGWDSTSWHGFSINSDPGGSTTIHNYRNYPNAPYKASVFDVVHDNGFSTGFFYGKAKFDVFTRSYGPFYGADDLVGADDGPDKIDYVGPYTAGTTQASWNLVSDVLSNLSGATPRNYTFIHFADPDLASVADFSNTVRHVDTQIGRLLAAIDASPILANRTAMIVTADHGGVPPGNHGDTSLVTNYTLPFFIWGPGVPAGVDAYSIFGNRADPGTNLTSYATVPMALRNGDSANVAMALLGLPPIPGSSLLPVLTIGPVSLAVQQSGASVVVSWPTSAAGYQLQAAGALGPAPGWQQVTSGIVSSNGLNFFSVVPSPALPARYYRLWKN
jgi:hypothetical protein